MFLLLKRFGVARQFWFQFISSIAKSLFWWSVGFVVLQTIFAQVRHSAIIIITYAPTNITRDFIATHCFGLLESYSKSNE